MRDFLETQIAALDRELAELDDQSRNIDQRRVVASAKRDAYRDALDQLPAGPDRDRKRHGRTGLRSGNWREVFGFIARNWPHPVTNDQMMAYALSNNLTLSRQALRAQLSTYTEKGALERVSDGVYRITESGAQELGIHFMGQTEAATDSESVAAFQLSNAERV